MSEQDDITNQNAQEEQEEAGGGPIIQSNTEGSSEDRLKRLPTSQKGFKVDEIFTPDGKSFKHIKAKKSDFVHNLVYLDGQKFDFTGREYLRQIYDAPWRHKVLVTGRQVEKSTMLANEIISNSCVIPYFKCLFVSTSHDQTRQFSNGKLKPWTEDSPVIQRYFQSSKVSKQVFEKSYTNGSITFLRSAFLNADRTRGISADLICYDRDAYVLTSLGWKLVSEVTTKDKIADFNPRTGKVEFNKPTRIVRKKHTGDMITFEHGGFRLRVTDNHTMWANFKVKHSSKYHTKDEWNFATAIDLYNSTKMGFKFTCKGDWDDSLPEKKVFPPWSVSQKSGKGTRVNTYAGAEFCYEDLAELVGWYLAEGFLTGSRKALRVCLTLNKEKDLQKIEPLLQRMDLTYRKHKDRSDKIVSLVINGHHIADFLKQNSGAYNKYIPREFFNSPKCLERLLYGLYSGDACYHKGEEWDVGTLRTRSKRLAEDTQEAWLRLGRPAVIHTRMTWNKHQDSEDYNEGEYVPLYEVCAYKLDYMIFWRADRDTKKRIVKERVSNEEVYCFTVKNHLPIVKGNHSSKPVISGQCLDEIQDMLSSNIPVILETASHSKYNWRIFAGTPKTLDNATETWWQAGSQCEWLVPCHRHLPVHYNYLDEKCIGKKGVICNKCGELINPAAGQWVALSSQRDVMSYRISQLMVPWIGGTEKGWKELLIKYESYSKGLFKNEVLGLSHDSATKPITRTELIACTSPKHPLRLMPDNFTRSIQLFAGIDWGEGSDGSERNFKGRLKPASYTVLTIGGFVDSRHFHVVFMKRYHGEDALPRNCVRDIIRICKEFGVKMIGVDWGHGWGVNDQLQAHFTAKQVVQFQYVGMQKEREKYDPIGHKLQLNRTEVMTDFFDELRARKWLFPPWEEISIFLRDVEHIFAEFRMKGDLVYDHKITEPDDAAHSLIMCREAARVYYKGG